MTNEDEIHPGYVTRDGMWAAIPFGNRRYMILHNGRQVHISNTIETARNYINRELRKKPK